MSNGEKRRSSSPNSVSKMLMSTIKKVPTASPVLATSIAPLSPELPLVEDHIPELPPQLVTDQSQNETGDAGDIKGSDNQETQPSRWSSLLFWNGKGDTQTVPESPQDEQAANPEGESYLWTIPNQMTRLSGLFVRHSSGENLTAGLLSDQFLPNTISPIKTASQIVNVTAADSQLAEAESSATPVDQSSWFTPWRWESLRNYNGKSRDSDLGDSSDAGTLTLDDDESKLFRKLVVSSIQCLSYGIDKPASWGIFTPSGDSVGEVRLTGNKSCRRGVLMKRLPKSNFEIQEESLQRPNSRGDESNNDPDDSVMGMSEAVVLPDLRWNYRLLTMSTKSRIFGARIFPCVKSEKHLYTLKRSTKRKVHKKVVVISVHGFLPQKFTKAMANESSGLAQVMSEYTNRELDRWGILNNVDLEVNNIQLEGYGKIFERMNDAMSIVENWRVDIQEADYVVMVCNSNSVTVGIHLLAKMVSAGMLFRTEKLGFIGISGLTLGPIPGLEAKILTRGGSAQENEMVSEMFDFEDPESLQSKELIRSFETIVRANCKVTFGASIQDCIAPLYSSLSFQFGHPNIFRLIYIDSAIDLPDFLVSLLNTVLALKNLNYSDHGLIVELSSFLEGKPQTGGHSGIMRDKHVYRMGLSNILDTNNLQTPQALQVWPRNVREMNLNPYHIPWCLRGALEELANVKANWDVHDMMHQLTQEFQAWDPLPPWTELHKCMEAFGTIRSTDIGL